MALCSNAGALEFGDACVRGTWAALLPAVWVGIFLLYALPIRAPALIRRFVVSPFKTFLPLHEAEALLVDEEDDHATLQVPQKPPLWRTVLFALFGLGEALCWIAYGSYRVVESQGNAWSVARPFVIATTWLYTVIKPITRPSPTPPYDVFILYVAHFVTGIIMVGGMLYDIVINEQPRPSSLIEAGLYANLVTVVLALSVILGMPLDVPSSRVKKDLIGKTVSTEDYTTLFGWITFNWVYPLVTRGKNTTLNESDVFDLSPSLASRPLFIKFSNIVHSSLLRRLWAANSLDLLLDGWLTVVSVVFNYSVPFFMNRILASIDTKDRTPSQTSQAYIYSLLMFTCTVLKAETDVQHLWFGRRATTRIRSELMAAIYDKALKRRDYSGIVDKKDATVDPNAVPTPEDKKAADAKADDPKAGADIGKIVNLMAGDAGRISNMVAGAYYLYGAPMELIVGGIFLYQLLGWSAFSGFVVLLIGWPFNTMISKRAIRIHKGVLTARDKRMGVLNELISAVKFIKFFAWEERWINRTLEAREQEMKWMVKSRLNSILFYILWNSTPILISVVSFFTYVVQGNELTVSKAFTAISLFSLIRAPLNVIPMWIVQVLQTGVALKRIEVFLAEDEVTEQVSSIKKGKLGSQTVAPEEEGLGLRNATLKWNQLEESKDETVHQKATTTDSILTADSDALTVTGSLAEDADHKFELKDISITFPEGQLTVVTGPTASGKTALLMAILGEMMLVSGDLIMSKDTSRIDENGFMHAISYASQSPWLRHQSIKDNILFGYPLDEERYQTVINACALRPDLAILEDGDATEIGAKGVSLSGGQKARVALARAVYARTKYVLLDDPLSAVDSHTARTLFENLLMGPLLKGRTVVLVTHHVELVLPGTDYLVRMLDGRIDAQGTVRYLRAQGILEDIKHEATIEAEGEEAKVADKELKMPDSDVGGAGENVDSKKPRKLVKDEHRESGGVKWSIYKTYLKASSYYIWGILVSLVLLSQMLGIVEKVWIKYWGEAYGADKSSAFVFNSFTHHDQAVISVNRVQGYLQEYGIGAQTFRDHSFNLPDAHEHPLFYVGIYASIGLCTTLISVSSAAAQYTGALKASRTLFKQLLTSVVRATFRFHDTTPQGRMLNRFGKDIETVDSSLASTMQTVNSSLASFFVSIITVAVVFPAFLVPALVLGLIYRELAVSYLNTGRDLRRLESNSRSPIFSDFQEVLEGIVTVRAFSAEKRFMDGLHEKVDMTTKFYYDFWMTNRWLLLNFDCLGAVGVLVTCLFSIGILHNNAGLAGLCITSALSFTSSVYWACRYWTGLELDLNSVERVVEYLDLPQEPPAIIEDNRPPAYWPSTTNGDLISVENLVIKYAPDLPAVLQDVSFTLRAGERIGLLGRTGSGKSTLAMSILRFVDPSSGRILIDGVDISKIGIHDLRERLTFIPQDATLFSGTLRENLDPFEERDDKECWEALYRVQMVSVSQMPSRIGTPAASRPASVHGLEREDTASSIGTDVDAKTTVTLDTKVSPGGTNFSQGQRQLIAMARALLRRSSIIVLDEATSSIDFSTDAKIQQTIREEFNNSLLLTVAHRLRTVIDYDRLIVLDKGSVAEFDTPWNLIRKEDGIFRTMCLKSGTFGELEAAAKAKAESSGQL
ncbi:hypothetical protein CYLTODRAFT_385456 [Cylindrobasidium torrendii FP15055 ss-10]|uniref:Multidrug resistance-associated ABC transporter n=1 Tax=Cylindrobasidium torrendii FP15055 ss-10 TaxID=1314674 RepID=A0A0D7BUF7_9AGAR|nr:hypothetical protein CYLTODRAFT_385456 [Cylindrobasidium torrendii FP15055 ss-10]